MVNAGLLLLASLALLMPATLAATHTELRANTSQLLLSRLTALCLFLVYGAFIYFQLKTHADLFPRIKIHKTGPFGYKIALTRSLYGPTFNS